MTKRVLKTFLIVVLPLLLLVLSFVAYLNSPVLPIEPKVTIEKGMPLKEISPLLAKQGIIRLPTLFTIYAEFLRKAGELKAGEYLFDKQVTPREVLDHLVKGLVYALKVRLIEGWTVDQIAEYLPGLFTPPQPNFKQSLLQLTKDPTFIQSLGIQSPSLEGTLFPETYYIKTGATPAEYLETFVKEFDKNYQKALNGLKTLPALSKNQIVTLASIIEKESGLEEERAVIASVFYNRLAKKMPLQSDPTIIYGLKNFDGNLRKKDITNPHPYNTYVHAGLPPGPICNPGLASLKAALQPAQTDYLYFVSKGDGTHYFSRTAEEHIEAVRQYQLKKE